MLFLFTTFLTAFYTFCICIEQALQIINVLSQNDSRNAWGQIFFLFVVCCLPWIMAYSFKKCVDGWQKCAKVPKNHRILLNLMHGLAFIAIAAIIARFQLENIVNEKREEILEMIVLFIVSLIAASYRLFIYKSVNDYEWKKQCSWTFVLFFGILVVIHSIAFYPLVSGAAKATVVYQIAFALICATSTLELYAIYMGKLKFKEEMELESVQVDANKESPNPVAISGGLEKPDFVKMWNGYMERSAHPSSNCQTVLFPSHDPYWDRPHQLESPVVFVIVSPYSQSFFYSEHQLVHFPTYGLAKTSVYTKCRNNIFCGLGIIATFAIIAKIGCSPTKHIDEFFVFAIINIFHASYVIFITPNEEFCEWKQKSGKVYEILLVILVTVQIVFFYGSILESVDHKENLNFLIIQFTFSLICASSTCDMLAILMGKLKLKEAKEEAKLEAVKVEKRPSASTQPAAHVGYLEVKEEIPLSTRFNDAVRALLQKN
ncbi:unnamed protein product [Caenorhabditis brenneri]